MSYFDKYLKYKTKYINLKNSMMGGDAEPFYYNRVEIKKYIAERKNNVALFDDYDKYEKDNLKKISAINKEITEINTKIINKIAEIQKSWFKKITPELMNLKAEKTILEKKLNESKGRLTFNNAEVNVTLKDDIHSKIQKMKGSFKIVEVVLNKDPNAGPDKVILEAI